MGVAALVPAIISAVGAVAGAAISARATKKAAKGQQQQPLEPEDPRLAERQSRKDADTGIALSTRNARRAGVGPTFRGTLLTGPQGIADSALNIGKTLLGQ